MLGLAHQRRDRVVSDRRCDGDRSRAVCITRRGSRPALFQARCDGGSLRLERSGNNPTHDESDAEKTGQRRSRPNGAIRPLGSIDSHQHRSRPPASDVPGPGRNGEAAPFVDHVLGNRPLARPPIGVLAVNHEHRVGVELLRDGDREIRSLDGIDVQPPQRHVEPGGEIWTDGCRIIPVAGPGGHDHLRADGHHCVALSRHELDGRTPPLLRHADLGTVTAHVRRGSLLRMNESTNAPRDAEPIRVFLLDDHEIVRRGLADLLDNEDDIEVVSEASTGPEALRVVAKTNPDVAVLDVRLEEGNGIEVCREIRSSNPDVACIILTSFSDDQALIDAAMAGAAGFVLKQVRGNELVESIRKVAGGAQLLDSATVRLGMARLKDSDEGKVMALTDQEHRIFDLIGEGYSNRQIADEMFLAEKTVKNYVSNMLAKLGMSRRTEAAAFAARLDERQRRKYE